MTDSEYQRIVSFSFSPSVNVNEPLGSVRGNFVVNVGRFLQALLCECMERAMLHEHKSHSTLRTSFAIN